MYGTRPRRRTDGELIATLKNRRWSNKRTTRRIETLEKEVKELKLLVKDMGFDLGYPDTEKP